MSVCWVSGSMRTCSGDMYAGEPTPAIWVVVCPGRLLERGAEIAHLGLALVREQDVPGLDVAVDDAVLEAYSSARIALEDDLDHLAAAAAARSTRGVRLERRAGHVLHHQVAVVGLDHRVVDLDDVRVVELAGERGLGDERLVLHALVLRVGVAVEQEHLDRDVALARTGRARGTPSWSRRCRFRAGRGYFPMLSCSSNFTSAYA